MEESTKSYSVNEHMVRVEGTPYQAYFSNCVGRVNYIGHYAEVEHAARSLQVEGPINGLMLLDYPGLGALLRSGVRATVDMVRNGMPTPNPQARLQHVLDLHIARLLRHYSGPDVMRALADQMDSIAEPEA